MRLPPPTAPPGAPVGAGSRSGRLQFNDNTNAWNEPKVEWKVGEIGWAGAFNVMTGTAMRRPR